MEDLGKLLGNTLVGEWRSTADGERHRRGEEREREREVGVKECWKRHRGGQID